MSPSAAQQQIHTAIAHHQQGDLATAASLYAQILQEQPNNQDAWHLSGLIAYQQQSLDQAEQLIRRALEISPGQPEFLSNLAAVLLADNRPEEAEQAARSSLQQQPGGQKCRKHLATALARQNQYGEAIALLQQLIAEDPLDANAYCNLGAMLLDTGRSQEAVAMLDTAVQLIPNSANARLNLGAALRDTGELHRSLAELDQAVQLGPQTPQCYINRGNTRLDLRQTSGALADFQKAVELDPRSATALNGLARTLQVLGHWDPALEAFDLACELNRPERRFDSNRLYCASLVPSLSRQELTRRHADWGTAIEQETPVLPRVTYQHSHMRIGYVSPDFRNHATMRFAMPLLRAHAAGTTEVYCYYQGQEDDVSTQIQQICAGWRNTVRLSDADLAAQIRADEIDVLIDLAGHTAGNRLPVFAARPAPVQLSFLGYPTTTGLTRLDGFLTDACRESSDSQQYFTEPVICLPHGACCFEAPADTDISNLPLRTTGHITFGSTHRLEKISDNCLQLWAQVLTAVPDSRLLIIRDSLVDEPTRQLLQQKLNSLGIDSCRLEFRWELPDEFLTIYHDIDIMLDVFPWGSGTTAYECMWMGVPIPTIAGDRGGCRATYSMMHHCGFPDLAANSVDEYLQLITGLAADPDRLQMLRSTIRPAMKGTVCDAQRFAQDIEHVCHNLLQQHSSSATASQEPAA